MSWAAKAGLTTSDKRMLGSHIQRSESSMMAYSRDALGGPLERLRRVILAIRRGEFKPDASRSGRWEVDSSDEVPGDAESLHASFG